MLGAREIFMNTEFASHFAENWIAAWNSHDLDRILSHYADDFEMSSPVIRTIANEPSGTLKGLRAVGEYWQKALTLIPNLHFELLGVYTGANSVILHYNGHRGFSAEFFLFGHDGKVISASAHYELD
jgi:hypothetical protein